ncbi:hypothetical protein PIB30_004659 [Stylosanthes scabra]|uniref:Uncharacterized protein n=1 Tax=Stylosanthes scabra TaxID=79078 RepID=A0ABU6Q3P2_9FABA|nr:hypothetical protein [Stylosanthes scabra]
MKESLEDLSYRGPTKVPSENTPKELQHGAWEDLSRSDTALFSRSLPVLPHEKLNLNGALNGFKKSHQEVEGNGLLEDVDTCAIGTMLPYDEEDLLADFDLRGLPNSLEDLEEYDLFGSGGGMELEADPQESLNVGLSKLSFSDGNASNGLPHNSFLNGAGTVTGEHPFGEHPSRTLFVRNINSNVGDSELRALFEQYGDIRTLYTACKHRGFDNPSDKDINQGTLVVFNLDPSVSNEELRTIFGAYGEVKEIRETPHKGHHKFIEFYDVRAAEEALKALNRSNIAGRRIKVEPSRPGGTRRNLMLQNNQELDHDEKPSFRHQMGSPVANSPPGYWLQFNSTVENNSLRTMSNSPGSGIMSPSIENHLPGLASILQPPISNAMKGVTIGKDLAGSSSHGVAFQSHSLPEPKFIQYNRALSSFGSSPSNGSSVETLSGPQFLWGSPKLYSNDTKPSAWPTPSLGHSFTSNGNSHGFQNSAQKGSFIGLSQSRHHHHVGSAPSGFPFDRNFGILSKSPETSFANHVGYGGIGLGHTEGNYMVNMGGSVNSSITIPRNMSEHGSPNIGMRSSPRLSPVVLGNGPYRGLPPATTTMYGFMDPARNRRTENNGGQADSSKKQFQLDLDRIKSNEDTRTTLMIKNIPNKYTSKMLLAAIDEKHKGTYDFFYLPIDFKNKCNVGYAFINMLSASNIIPFYETFNAKKWEKFNSEKVASLAYARIQGKAALVNHFQNSSLMNEDERCRPIVFHSENPEGGGDKIMQDHLLSNKLNVQFLRSRLNFHSFSSNSSLCWFEFLEESCSPPYVLQNQYAVFVSSTYQMPSVNMKSEVSTTCLTETKDLHVCSKSKVISKKTCSKVVISAEVAGIDTTIQNLLDVSSVTLVSAKDIGSGESIDKKEILTKEKSESQMLQSFSVDPSSLESTNPCAANMEAIFSTAFEPIEVNSQHFAEDAGSIGGTGMSGVGANESDDRRIICGYETCDVSDFSISDMIITSLPLDRDSFDHDICEMNSLSDYRSSEPTMLDASDQYMILPALEDDIKTGETLVHSSLEHSDDADFTFTVFFNMKEHTVYVRKRPNLCTFLERVSEMFEVVIFTASQSIYAKQLLDILDPEGRLISRRVYRESCIFSDGNYTKDLTVLGVDLAKVVIIDNSPQVFRLQVNNGIPIKSWFDDPMDCALMSLLPFLETLADADDVRPIIAQRFGNKE